MLLNCGAGEDSWESLGLQGDPTSPSWRISVLGVHWNGWCWSWNSNTLATWCEELAHWKRPWCWERLRAGGEGDNRGWSGWMASPTQWTWIWVNFRSWWRTGRPGMLQSTGSPRVKQDWATELNWKSILLYRQRSWDPEKSELSKVSRSRGSRWPTGSRRWFPDPPVEGGVWQYNADFYLSLSVYLFILVAQAFKFSLNCLKSLLWCLKRHHRMGKWLREVSFSKSSFLREECSLVLCLKVSLF